MKAIKKFTIFAGVNGAGKSTLYYAEANCDLGIRLNSDEILHSSGLDWRDSSAQMLAGKFIEAAERMFRKWSIF